MLLGPVGIRRKIKLREEWFGERSGHGGSHRYSCAWSKFAKYEAEEAVSPQKWYFTSCQKGTGYWVRVHGGNITFVPVTGSESDRLEEEEEP